MTIATKPQLFPKVLQPQGGASKAKDGDTTVVCLEDEDNVRKADQRKLTQMMVVLVFFLVLMLMLLTSQFIQVSSLILYSGYCNIPLPAYTRDLVEGKNRMQKLRWSSSPESLEPCANGDAGGFLREHVEIGDTLEKITVYDNNKEISFVNDFAQNLTGIADVDRCFVLSLQREWAPPPQLLLQRIERGEPLDLSVARSTMRVVLPPPRTLLPAWAPELCGARPTYVLDRNPCPIRKRSTEERAHEYLQFAGHHIAAITISNIAELEDYESKNKKN